MDKPSVWHIYRGNNPAHAEFDKRHGGRSVLKGSYYYYSDGAVREGGRFAEWGQHIEPSDDPLERQKQVLRFYDIASRASAKQFYWWRDNRAIHNPQDEEIVETLKELQQQVLDFRKGYRKAEGELLRIEYGAATVKEARKMKADYEEQAALAAEKRASDEAEAIGRVKSIRI